MMGAETSSQIEMGENVFDVKEEVDVWCFSKTSVILKHLHSTANAEHGSIEHHVNLLLI